jgi:putative ABC transport system permease protein
LGQIRANKTRSFLTALGIIIGVASVTAVIAGLTGMKTDVLADFNTIGAGRMFAWADRPDTGPMSHADWPSLMFRPEQMEGLLQNCPSIECFTMITGYPYGGTIRHGDRSTSEASLSGVQPGAHKVANRSVILGRELSLIDDKERRQVCVITPDLRDKLGLDRDCIGESIQIGDRLFTVVGIVEPPAEMRVFGGASGPKLEAAVPFGTAYLPGSWIHMEALAKSPKVAQEAKAELAFFLRNTRNVKPGEPNTFGIETLEQYIEQFNSIAAAVTAVAGGIVAISLLVGGVGIMNTMLVSVSERTREIGLRKAVGARPSAIMLQFLVEAVTLCLVGGAVGLGCGRLLTMALASIPDAPLKNAFIPGWAVALSFGFSAAVGLVFGMFPAIRAARFNPIDALRHE